MYVVYWPSKNCVKMKNLLRVLLALLFIYGIGCTNEEPIDVIAIESIEVNPQTVELEVGESVVLDLVITPVDAQHGVIDWQSDNNDVATVDDSGRVEALSAGTATVIASVDGFQATCAVTVVAPVPDTNPHVGDFYYSDGSWSAELDAERTVIGIVFWTGDPTVDDAALQRDHPDCTHGLVVGLKHARTAWQSNFSESGIRVSAWVEDNTTDYEAPIASDLAESMARIIGYNNTKAIELFNAAPENQSWKVEAVEAVVAYRDECVAPEASSDWYLPSPKELSLLCSGEYDGNIYYPDTELGNANRKLINERMTLLENINSLGGITHWSSAEFDEREVDEEAMRVGWMVAVNAYFSDGDISVAFKDSTTGHVRYILAF